METPTLQTFALQITRRYDATCAKVFDALVNPASLAKWFAPNDEMTISAEFDPVPGGRYRVEMHHELGATYRVGGVYEVVDTPNNLVFTWQWEDEPMNAMGNTRVSITVREMDGGTELTLVHDGFPAQEAADSHNDGWAGCLWRLERLFGDSALQSVSGIFAINRKLYANALDGIADSDLTKRSTEATNHLLWLAGHLAHNRATIANLLGASLESPLAMFNEPISADTKYPELAEIMEYFATATGAILKRIPLVGPDVLVADSPYKFPIADNSILGVLSFFAQHEAYHIGQMSYIRKQLGHPATSYADRTS